MKFSEACTNVAALTVAAWFAVCTTRFAVDHYHSPLWFLFVALAALFWSWTALFAVFLVSKGWTQ